MFGFMKKKDSNSGPKSFTVKAKITKGRDEYDISDEYVVELEGSGFTGIGTKSMLSLAFEAAYKDLMNKVSQAIFQDK